MHTPIESFGWNAFFISHFASFQSQGLIPGRIAVEHKSEYLLLTEGGERKGELSGRLRFSAGSAAELPRTGDWVACADLGPDSPLIIQAVLPRQTQLVRRAAGQATEAQVIAANLDYILIVMGLDANFNLNRLERYLIMVQEGGAQPVVVLNKSDQAYDLDSQVAAVKALTRGAPVLVTQALEGRGLEDMEPFLMPGKTLALVGSSGVGKSTLVNLLLGEKSQLTQAIREIDGRGRHTTTRRELFQLPGGALLIDTPGMRELQLWDAGEGMASVFEEIEALAAHCRFADCRHEQEPGCAVQEAIASGELPEARYRHYLKLLKEQAYLEGHKSEYERRQEERKLHRMYKKMAKKKGRE